MNPRATTPPTAAAGPLRRRAAGDGVRRRAACDDARWRDRTAAIAPHGWAALAPGSRVPVPGAIGRCYTALAVLAMLAGLAGLAGCTPVAGETGTAQAAEPAPAAPTASPAAVSPTGLPATVAAAAQASSLPFTDRADGISCSYHDVMLGIAWPGGKPVGVDWPAGKGPAATPLREVIDASDARRVRRVDLTALVQGWWNGEIDNDGLLIRMVAGSVVEFHAREAPDPTLRPQLELVFADGRKRYVEPAADAALDCSTYRGLGQRPTLVLQAQSPLALRFAFDTARAGGGDGSAPVTATLVLVRVPPTSASGATLQFARLLPPLGTRAAAPEPGLAQRYPQDAGIAADPDVLFADGFERGLAADWTTVGKGPVGVVRSDPGGRFEPFIGAAMKSVIPRGQNLGLDIRLKFARRPGGEPDEVYFRYALRLAADWVGAVDGGKLPGLAGTYNRAGWGGRPWDGRAGWSLRGSYAVVPPASGHPKAGQVMLGTYAYHAKADGLYGEPLPWVGGGLGGLIPVDRWVVIEQHLRLNTPGREDGVLEVWVDGRRVLERRDLRVRDVDTLHVEEVWMNLYHGGTQVTPVDMTAYIDQVVVARRYIGPPGPGTAPVGPARSPPAVGAGAGPPRPAAAATAARP